MTKRTTRRPGVGKGVTAAERDANRRYASAEARRRAGEAARKLAEKSGKTPREHYHKKGR